MLLCQQLVFSVVSANYVRQRLLHTQIHRFLHCTYVVFTITLLLLLCVFFRERRETVAHLVVVVMLVMLVLQETRDHLALTEMMVPPETRVKKEQRVQLDQQELQ